MKKVNTTVRWIEQILALATFSLILTHEGRAQGTLMPPGAPAATMKTLQQVEPRTPISRTPFVINASGSYYLAANLTPSGSDSAIVIMASDVSLDLNGFTISGAAANNMGVYLFAVANVVVENGSIRDCAFDGISGLNASNCIFRNLRVIGNSRISDSYAGLISGKTSIIENCFVKNNAGTGIRAYAGSKICDNLIEGNTAAGLYINGKGSYVADNIVKGNGDNYAIDQGNQLNLLLCEIPETLEWPCSVKLAGTLKTTLTETNGITIAADDVTIDMAGHTLVGPGAASGHGIYQDYTNRNLRVFNGKAVHWAGPTKTGIYASGTASILADLQAATNNNGIIGTQTIGPLITATGTISSENPWANFSY